MNNKKIEKLNSLLKNALQEAEMRQGCSDYQPYVTVLREQLCQLLEQDDEPDWAGARHHPELNETKPQDTFLPCKKCGMLILANKQRCPNCGVVDPLNRGIVEPIKEKKKDVSND